MITISIFILLFCCILAAIKKMTLIEGNIQIVLAVCVTVLCGLALQQMFVDGHTTKGDPGATVVGRSRPPAPTADKEDKPETLIPTVLLPYAALALTLILLPFLLLISAILRTRAWQKIRDFFRRYAVHDRGYERGTIKNEDKRHLFRS